ncbi:OmpA/MotB domain protein [Thiorhodococcus drewsii AZ1]|uniref:OmpA/MotB domain protein n=1 Tax=Thiorhodococcus drewsii AZ1 TaxID=765913 RepID=G2DWX2_9GAMM|nr:OmpA family protein [Thiorhodococcus drewsii]EGV33326.1 OmpA/MotB domain protein [Thiorhodococcus drewsii AZ1]
MSDTQASSPWRSGLAIAYLALTFAAGLLFVYSVDATYPSADPGGIEPESAANSEAARDPALAAELADTQARMETLETTLAALKQDQITRFEAERQRLTEELTEILDADRSARKETQPSVQPETTATPTLEEDLAGLDAQPTEDGLRISLGESELSFPSGSADLGNTNPKALARIADLLARRDNLRVLLRGHTDSQGKETTNLKLSEERARAVKDLLVASGVSEERIQVEGFGERSPIAANETQEGRARNRRVELYLSE